MSNTFGTERANGLKELELWVILRSHHYIILVSSFEKVTVWTIKQACKRAS